jgi:hypothetical protein
MKYQTHQVNGGGDRYGCNGCLSCFVLSREVNSGNGGLSLTLYSLLLALPNDKKEPREKKIGWMSDKTIQD